MDNVSGVKLTIPIGDISYTYGLDFLLSLTLAIVVVFLFSRAKFSEPTIQKNDDDLITQLLPKYLTTSEEYARALNFYVMLMIGIVVVLSFLGPRVFALGAKDMPDAPNALPLFVALIIVGMLPNVPWLQELERHLRRFAHERALIPRAARATAEQLASSDFDFQIYKPSQVLNSPTMRGVELADFSSSRDSVEYSWARLSCILYQLRRMQDAGLIGQLDGEVLDQYAKDFDNLALKRKSLEDDIAAYRKQKSADLYYTDDNLHLAIRKALRQLYILLACAVRLNLGDDNDMNSGLLSFGFLLHPAKINEGNRNIMIVGLAVMTVSVFFTVYLAIGIEWLFSSGNLWHPSEDFPKAPFEPFKWAISSVLSHGMAIFVAERMRRRRLAKERWFAKSGTRLRRNAANYVLVAAISGIAGGCVLYIWSLLFVGPSITLAIIISPISLLPAATGGFYVFHLDSADLNSRPSRVFEMGPQALVTGFCGFAAASASRALYGVEVVPDIILFNAVIGIVIGASLAWYIPDAAASNKYDPIADVLATRIVSLKAAAAKKYGSEQAAQQWVEQPNPNLDNCAPKSVVADIAMYEKAVTLLRAA